MIMTKIEEDEYKSTGGDENINVDDNMAHLNYQLGFVEV